MNTITITGADGLENTYAADDYETVAVGLLASSRVRANRDIESVAPQYKQNNAALGLLSVEETNTIKACIQTSRNRQNTYQSALEDIQADDALTPVQRVLAMAALIY